MVGCWRAGGLAACQAVLFLDSAVAGEAAAIAIGLLLLGAGSSAQGGQAVTELLRSDRPMAHPPQRQRERAERGRC